MERSIALFKLVDPAEAGKHQRARGRLEALVRGLEGEARLAEAKIKALKEAGGGPQLRVRARELRCLEEKLNRVPGSIRLGKKWHRESPNSQVLAVV